MATTRRSPHGGFRADHSLAKALASKGSLVVQIIEAHLKSDEGAFRQAALAFAKRESQSRHHVTARKIVALLGGPDALRLLEVERLKTENERMRKAQSDAR